jgi:hypothetical protein
VRQLPRPPGIYRGKTVLAACPNVIPLCRPTWYVFVMDSALAARLNPGHRQRLEWFEEHQGQISPFPPPLNDGMLLAAKAKGIYKPKSWPMR